MSLEGIGGGTAFHLKFETSIFLLIGGTLMSGICFPFSFSCFLSEQGIRITSNPMIDQSALALPPFVRKGKTFRLVYVSSSPLPSPGLCEGPLGFPWRRGHVEASLVSILAVVAPQASRGLVSPGTFSAGLNAVELRVDTLSLLTVPFGWSCPL